MNLTGRPIFQKTAATKDKRRLEAVANLPCCICHEYGMLQETPTAVHHCIHGRHGQHKAPDSMTIPLCWRHHQGPDGVHTRPAWWRENFGEDTRWISWTEERI